MPHKRDQRADDTLRYTLSAEVFTSPWIYKHDIILLTITFCVVTSKLYTQQQEHVHVLSGLCLFVKGRTFFIAHECRERNGIQSDDRLVWILY